MNTNDFFESVYRGELSDLDIYNKAQELTDNFKETKLSLLWDEYMNFLNKGASRSTYKNFEDWIPEDPFEYQFKQLGSLLSIHIKSKTSEHSIQPIKWLKSEEALRQLIESLKENGLIQSRETEDIIQHFEVSGREAKQAKQEPINWLKSKALLAYLINKLSEEPEESAPFIEDNKKWHLVKLHFVVKGKKITRSLVGDLSQTMYPNGCIDIDDILKRLPAH